MNAIAEERRESRRTSTKAGAVPYVLDIVNLSKSFQRQTTRSGYTTVKSWLLSLFTSQKRGAAEITCAVKDLTLRIPRGASVGVIGRNGSGKSTLLKLITGIYKPDHGKVSITGRVAALIELGAGFHPDFTGRENLFLAGIMHGLTKREVEERFDDIVDFAELRGVIDDPVRTYSSGMFMRLGFSIAIHTDPDMLLIDEVLAVGDAAFVAKCRDRITTLRKEGKTLMLVSHDLDAVERWCDEAIWLHGGVVKDRGDPRRVIDHYREFLERGEEADLQHQQLEAQEADAIVDSQSEPAGLDPVLENGAGNVSVGGELGDQRARWGSREIEISAVRMVDQRGESHLLFHPDDAVRVEIDYQVNESVHDVVFGVGVHRSDGLLVHGTNTDLERVDVAVGSKGGRVTYEFSRLGLLEGSYTLDVAVHRKDGYPYDYHQRAVTFAVRSPLRQIGVYAPQHRWEFREQV